MAQLDQGLLNEVFKHLDLASRKHLASTNKALCEVFRFSERNVRVPGKELADALKKFPNAELVTVVHPFTEADVAGIDSASQYRNVTSLDLSYCRQFSVEAIIALAEKLPNLSMTLDLGGGIPLHITRA